MTTQTNTTSTPAPESFWKLRHALIGLGVLAVLVMLMMRACGDDDGTEEANADRDKPRQAIAVQIPASQWPSPQQQAQQALPQVQPQQHYGYAPQQMQPTAPQPQQNYGYVPQQLQPVNPQPQAPVAGSGNPWAVQQQPYSYGRPQSQQWGREQPTRPQYAQPSTQSQYRPLEQQAVPVQPQQQVPQQQAPVVIYRPSAPYDRRSGSSFGTTAYPYTHGGGYPGHYGAPGMYAPGWGAGGPLGYPAGGYPGFW